MVKAALAFFAVALLLATAYASNDACDMFAIRNRGETLFFIDATNGVLGIPHDLEVGSVQTTQVILGDYLLNVYPGADGETLGIRKRIMDDSTGRYHVPRAILQFALDGTHVLYNDEIRDASEFTLYELRDYMRIARADELALEGHNDPFNMQWGYTSSGDFCKDGPDCVSSMDDIFEEVTLGSAPGAAEVLQSLWDLTAAYPQAGEDGYAGQVQSITATLQTSTVEGARPMSMKNDAGVSLGSPRFRLADDEVTEVFVLEATWIENWEVTPGVHVSLHGWKGGKVLDFAFDDQGWLKQGHIVVGPHPATDANDVVFWSPVTGWSGLQAQVPGPALRISFLANARIYFSNSITGASVHHAWVGFEIPQDQAQATVAPGANWVQEFVNHNVGGHQYSGNRWSVDVDSGLAGPVITDYPDMGVTADREYITFLGAVPGANVLNGNTFPGTARRLSGWYRDVIAIESSMADEAGNTIVYIHDVPRPAAVNVDTDPLNPAVQHECPANGGPLIGRVGTGCVVGGVHVNKGHQITSTTLSPGQTVEVWDHVDYAEGSTSINGQHQVVRVNDTAFLIPGVSGAGGVGGFVAIWRLHKSDPEVPTAQNNGVSGGYYRFNYGERIHMRFFNSYTDEAPLHIHGHEWAVLAQDGYLLDFPYTSQEVTIAGSSTVDAFVVANNPNRYGSWILSSTELSMVTFPNHPWPAATSAPGGWMAFVDYTGKRQGVLAVDNNMWVQSFWKMPPFCTVESQEITLQVDHRGYAYDHSQYLRLIGSAVVRNEVVPGTTLTYSWTRDTTKTLTTLPGRVFQDSNTLPWARVYGMKPTSATVASTYYFNFVATAQLKNRPATETVSCPPVSVKVTVLPTEYPLPANEAVLAPVKVHIAKSDDHEVLVAPTTPAGLADGMRSFPRGQATFPLYEAASKFNSGTNDYHSFNAASFFVDGFSHSLANFAALRFYRWPAVGKDWQNPDYWFNVPYDLDRDEHRWVWAVKKAVYDGRVTTYGFVLGTSIGAGVDGGKAPASTSSIVYPMWQGASVAGSDFNSRHEVYFLILEASDAEFCEHYGCVYTPTLATVPFEALNEVNIARVAGQPSVKNPTLLARKQTGTFANDRATEFLFNLDPPQLPVNPFTKDNGYSPLKHFRFVGADGVSRSVIANMPFVYWGLYQVQSATLPTAGALRAERKMLIVDEALPGSPTFCDPYIRSFPANPTTDLWADNPSQNEARTGFWNVDQSLRTIAKFPEGGPPGCRSDTTRYRKYGGQLLDVPNFRKMYVAFKIHQTQAQAGVLAYYSLTDTSDYAEAQFHGIVWSPKLKALGRSGSAVATIKQVGNGVAQGPIGGSLPGSGTYTPFWHMTNLFWNCGTYWFGTSGISGDFQPLVIKDVVNADQPNWRSPLNRVLLTDAKANTAYPPTSQFTDQYPLIANIKTTLCPAYAAMHTGRASGFIYSGEEAALIAKGVLLETESPAGSESVSASSSFVLYNSHVSVSFDVNGEYNPEDWVVGFENLPDYDDWSQGLAQTKFGMDVWLQGVWGVFRRTAVPDSFYAGNLEGFDTDLYAYYPIQDSVGDNLWDYPSLWEVIPPSGSSTGVGVDAADSWYPVAAPGATLDTSSSTSIASTSYFSNGAVSYGGASTLTRAATTPFVRFNAPTPYTINRDVLYTIASCSDSKFATLAGVAFTPALSEIEEGATTRQHWWEEPEQSSDGTVSSQALKQALRSFIFYESPPLVGPTPDAVLASFYTPYKRFSFFGREVTCNMPFYKWGTADGQKMKEDVLTSDPCLTAATCTPALNRAGVEQVLAVRTQRKSGNDPTLLAYDFTVKIHRAVQYNDNVYPYFAIFDSSDAVFANYYGVPQSGRSARAGRATVDNGVTVMNVFQNGLQCSTAGTLGATCFNTKARNGAAAELAFQEPVAPHELTLSPVHQWAYTLWKCAAPFTGAAFAAFAADEGTACPAAVLDAYNKKITQSQSGVVFTGEVEKLIDEGRVWQISSASQPIIVNSPFIAKLTFPIPSTDPTTPTPATQWETLKKNGNTYVLYGTDSAKYWSWSVTPSSKFVEGSYSIAGTSQLMPTSVFPGQSSTVYDVALLSVKPGDRVIIHILPSQFTPHGFVMGSGVSASSKDDVASFFEINWSTIPSSVTYNVADSRFNDLFGGAPFGYTMSTLGPLQAFDGYVKLVHAYSYILATSYPYGPKFMTVKIVVGDYTL